jgi:SAM-dependent methyltransferase
VCTNPQCGHAWLRAHSRAEDTYPADYYTHAPADPGLASRLLATVKRSRVGQALGYVMYLQGVRPGRLLEVGCGSGERLSEMRARGWDVHGVEPDATAAAVARDHYRVPVVTGTLDEAALPPATFDAVVMTHVIEHVADPLPLLRACRAVLRPGGRLVVTCPNLAAFGHRRYGAAWIALDAPRHEHVFTRASLVALARKAGFETLRARTSVRGAWGNLVGSEQVRAHGDRRHRASLALKARGLVLSGYELATLVADKDAGEEIALIAS